MSNLAEILKAPIKTLVTIAGIILVPTAVVVYAYSVDFVNDRRDHDEFRQGLIEATEILSTTATQQSINTIEINTLTTESKNNRDQLESSREQDKEQWDQLMDVLKTVIETR